MYIVKNLYSDVGGYVDRLLLFFHVWPADRPIIKNVALCHKNVGGPCIKHLMRELLNSI